MNKLANPGSKEAIAAGCRCPVIDNHYGKGFPIKGKKYPIRFRGEIAFWYTDSCEYHKPGKEISK